MNDTSDELFDPADAPGLGPDPRPGRWSIAQVDAALERVFSARSLDAGQRALVRALALLWHDHLDEAHEIVQDHADGDGAYLHGIMHRREPDYWNAKYWFRRVGGHPFFGSFGAVAASLPGGDAFVVGGMFESAAFVDAVEVAVRGRASAAAEKRLEAIQAEEFCRLFAHLTA